jgi:hypothetical protein
VKAIKRPATDEEMLRDYPRRSRTPHWFVRVKEFANRGWIVTARDRWGREITHTGGDADVPRMIEDVEQYAPLI